nr:MAG TPA: hypothetical protein [Caudoviricetes sp.]
MINIVLAIDRNNRFNYHCPIETKHRHLSEVRQLRSGDSVRRTSSTDCSSNFKQCA